jgi:hypothetical protein
VKKVKKYTVQEIKEHFNYCMEEGLMFGEQEETLLEQIYKIIEEQEKEKQWLYGNLNQISWIIEKSREESKKF